MDIQEIRFLQANVGRGLTATSELIKAGYEKNVKVLLISEPYVGSKGELTTKSAVRIIQATNRNGPVKAAIAILDQRLNLEIDPNLQKENIAVGIIKSEGVRFGVISVYLEGNGNLDEDIAHLTNTISKINMPYLIIGGDFNAWSIWWGSRKQNSRGDVLSSWFTEMNLHILNSGSIPTFETYRQARVYESFVDITVCSETWVNC